MRTNEHFTIIKRLRADTRNKQTTIRENLITQKKNPEASESPIDL